MPGLRKSWYEYHSQWKNDISTVYILLSILTLLSITLHQTNKYIFCLEIFLHYRWNIISFRSLQVLLMFCGFLLGALDFSQSLKTWNHWNVILTVCCLFDSVGPWHLNFLINLNLCTSHSPVMNLSIVTDQFRLGTPLKSCSQICQDTTT